MSSYPAWLYSPEPRSKERNYSIVPRTWQGDWDVPQKGNIWTMPTWEKDWGKGKTPRWCGLRGAVQIRQRIRSLSLKLGIRPLEQSRLGHSTFANTRMEGGSCAKFSI